jgi:integral membrane protein
MSAYTFQTLLGRLRIVAVLEGISFLLLFAVSMPLKYLMHITAPNKVIGIIHGLLFVLYIIMVFQAMIEYRWKSKKVILAIIAALLPFGAFWAEKKLFNDAP